jgi:hypothetical protein
MTCQSCKNTAPERIIDPIELTPFREHHGDKPFAAYRCHLCQATWHAALEPEPVA